MKESINWYKVAIYAMIFFIAGTFLAAAMYDINANRSVLWL